MCSKRKDEGKKEGPATGQLSSQSVHIKNNS